MVEKQHKFFNLVHVVFERILEHVINREIW